MITQLAGDALDPGKLDWGLNRNHCCCAAQSSNYADTQNDEFTNGLR
jgi:hypothetical protein